MHTDREEHTTTHTPTFFNFIFEKKNNGKQTHKLETDES